MNFNRLASKLYPKWWRDRYGEEFAALLDDARPGLRGTLDICKGALTMQLTTWTPNRILPLGAFAGLAIGAAATFFITPMYDSTALLQVATSPNKETSDRFDALSQTVMSRGELMTIIKNLNLYSEVRRVQPLAQIIERMKENTHFVPAMAVAKRVSVLQIRFVYPDPFDAQKTVSALVTKFIDEDRKIRDRASYESGSKLDDMANSFVLLNPASLPEDPTYPGRNKLLFSGLAGGTVIGGLLFLVARVRKAPPKA